MCIFLLKFERVKNDLLNFKMKMNIFGLAFIHKYDGQKYGCEILGQTFFSGYGQQKGLTTFLQGSLLSVNVFKDGVP